MLVNIKNVLLSARFLLLVRFNDLNQGLAVYFENNIVSNTANLPVF